VRLTLHNDRAHKEETIRGGGTDADDLLRLSGTARNKLKRA